MHCSTIRSCASQWVYCVLITLCFSGRALAQNNPVSPGTQISTTFGLSAYALTDEHISNSRYSGSLNSLNLQLAQSRQSKTFQLGPYKSDLEGFFQNADTRLYYNIDLPKNTDDPLTLIIIGHGSGPSKAKDNKKFAKPLVKLGYAVMTYDRRGIGRSEGVYSKAWSDLRLTASDLTATVEFVRNHQQLNIARIGLYGQSQSGWVIPMAASQSKNVDFFVILSGPVVSTATTGHYNNLSIQNPELSAAALTKRLSTFVPPEGDVDIVPTLKGLDMPGLWVFGAEDRVQPTAKSMEILKRLKEELQKPFDMLVLDDAGHSLRNSEGKPVNYRTQVAAWLSHILR